MAEEKKVDNVEAEPVVPQLEWEQFLGSLTQVREKWPQPNIAKQATDNDAVQERYYRPEEAGVETTTSSKAPMGLRSDQMLPPPPAPPTGHKRPRFGDHIMHDINKHQRVISTTTSSVKSSLPNPPPPPLPKQPEPPPSIWPKQPGTSSRFWD